MMGPVEHGAYQVVKPAVDLGKHRGGGLFNHIDPGNKIAGLANQKFTGFKSQFKSLP